MSIRIDEFSSPDSWDGVLDSTEQTRFLLFGFDIQLGAFVESWRELMCFDSVISTAMEFNSILGGDCNG